MHLFCKIKAANPEPPKNGFMQKWFQTGFDKGESVPNRIGAGLDRKTTFRNGKPIIRTGLERIMRVHVGICRLYTQSAEAELDFSMISKELVFRFPGTNFSWWHWFFLARPENIGSWNQEKAAATKRNTFRMSR